MIKTKVLQLVFLSFLVFCSCIHAGIPFMTRDDQGNYHIMKWSSATGVDLQVYAASCNSLSNSAVITEVQSAVDVWNAVPTASIGITVSETLGGPMVHPGYNTPDFINYVYFSNSTQYDASIIGITYVTADQTTGEIGDADIVLNQANYQFISPDSGVSNLDNGVVLLRTAITHELGHLLGLDHSPLGDRLINNEHQINRSTMYPFLNDNQLTLEQDDISIISFHYPRSGNPYQYGFSGYVKSGEADGLPVNEAHVVAFDYFSNPTVAISAISGFTTTGSNNQGYFNFEGLPSGNYTAFIEPFPLADSNGTAQFTMANDTNLYDNMSTLERASFNNYATDFSMEFWHNASESQYELTSGFATAENFIVSSSVHQIVTFITNTSTSLPNLANSEFTADNTHIYANGQTSTRVWFKPIDIYGAELKADISSQLEFRISTGSFSAIDTVITTTPTFVGDGYRYYSEVFSTVLTGNNFIEICDVELYVNDVKLYSTPMKLYFEKANPVETEIDFYPDIALYMENGATQTGTDVLANGASPATWIITPRFSDGTIIETPITTSSDVTFLDSTGLDDYITTYPIVSVENNLYQTTMTSSEITAISSPTFYLDGVKLIADSMRFTSISTTNTRIYLDANTIFINHPSLTTTPVANLYIEPVFEDGSSVPALLDTSADMDFTVLRAIDNTPANVSKGPITITSDSSGNLIYTAWIQSSSDVDTFIIEVTVLGEKLEDTLVLKVDVVNPDTTEINEQEPFILSKSSQEVEVEIIPRFTDGSVINHDLTSFLWIQTQLGTIRNLTGDVSSTAIPSIRPTYQNGRYLVYLMSPDETGDAIISGRVNSLGYKQIKDRGIIRSVDPNANLIKTYISESEISANGTSITTITLVPYFADGSTIGEAMDENLLTANISEGEFLRKAEDPSNPGHYALFPVGDNNVHFFNEQDGTYTLSVRSTNYSTTAMVEYYVDGVLSLVTDQILFSTIGSADPSRTYIKITPPLIYGDGKSRSLVSIYPRAYNGEPLTLSSTSSVIVQPDFGRMVGVIKQNLDGSYTQSIESEVTSRIITSTVSVIIDGVTMNPGTTHNVRFVNVDASVLMSSYGYPDSKKIDGFDLAAMSRAIRDQSCVNFAGDCSLDFNQDGTINTSDMELLLSSFGKDKP